MIRKTIYLAGGCYWGVQRFLSVIPGVLETEAGFANGSTRRPTYREVCQNNTGHAETVRCVYDASRLPLSAVLRLFFRIIDPLSVNKQGEDCGTQYRTGIYYTDEGDLSVIRAEINALEKKLLAKTAVEILPLEAFDPAEESHQDYLMKNPGGYCHVHLGEIAKAARTEVLNVYDKDGLTTGECLIRGDELPEGRYRGVADMFIVDNRNRVLVMQRDDRKETCPGKLEASAGGAILFGETPEEAAIREAKEETGIDCHELFHWYTQTDGPAIHDAYLFRGNIPENAIQLQEGETVGYRWVPFEEFLKIAESGDYAPSLWRRQKKNLPKLRECLQMQA